MTGQIYIGTSGWNYPHWRGPFYPEALTADQWLQYYSSQLQCVEINNSFYRLPETLTFRQWAGQTPQEFCFAVKASRFITHLKKLKACKGALKTFLAHSKGLGKKLGPVLFQLPPRWHANPQRLAEFLAWLPKDWRYTFEFRDPDWHNNEIYHLLSERNIAFCIYELGGFQSPMIVTADFIYVRLHGPKEAYCGSYRKQTLARWAARLKDWQRDNKDVYIFFDNDEAGYAADNALKLNELITLG